MTEQGTDYLFVIDTDQYAGNFERDMCAFLTGRVGDCGVGEEMRDLFYKEFGDDRADEMFENIASIADEHGCSRPATIWPNPRYSNDGMGGHYLVADADQEKLCAIYVKAIEEYEIPQINQKKAIIVQLQKGETVSNWTVSAAEREIKRHEDAIAKAKKLKKVSAFPAYMSVGIWFYEKPTEEQIAILKERTGKFLAAYHEANKEYSWRDVQINIQGFRLITFVKTSSEKVV